MKNTANFTREEFLCPCCNKEQMQQSFVDTLQKFRDNIGVPIYVTSGYRCAKRNEELVKTYSAGKTSRHMSGDAADIKVHGMTTERVTELALAFGFDGIGIYDGHVHVDERGYKANWDFRINKNAEHVMYIAAEAKNEQKLPEIIPVKKEDPEITIKEVIQEPPEVTELEKEYKKDLEKEEAKKNVSEQEDKTNNENKMDYNAKKGEKDDTSTVEEVNIKHETFGEQIGRFSNIMMILLTVIVGGMHIMEIPVNTQMENLWFIGFGKILGNEGLAMLTKKRK